MSELSLAVLKAKRFGKKRAASEMAATMDNLCTSSCPANESERGACERGEHDWSGVWHPETMLEEVALRATSVAENTSDNVRYIPASVKHFVWQRDKGCCTNCGSRRNINYDHVQPVACGGTSVAENLRLLCFSCNQRASINVFGDATPWMHNEAQ